MISDNRGGIVLTLLKVMLFMMFMFFLLMMAVSILYHLYPERVTELAKGVGIIVVYVFLLKFVGTGNEP